MPRPDTLKFVVATHGGLYQFAMSRELEILSASQIDEGYHYGISVDFDSATNTSTVYAYRGGPGRENVLPKEIRTWHFDGESMKEGDRTLLHPDAGDIHQISCHAKNGFLIANSHTNSIDRWTPQTGLLDKIHINDIVTDINHVNSVLPVGDVVAVMLHNFRKLESQIVVLEDSGELLHELGRFSLKDWCCHNIGIIDQWLYFNASSDQSIVKINLETLRESKRTKFKEHTKGMCSDGEMIFAGMSDCASRAERVRSCGWLSLIDPKSLELIRSVQLEVPGLGTAVGNVNEVRLLNMTDVFDRPTNVDENVLRNCVDVAQSKVAIACRRAWIRGMDRFRRTVGSMLSK